MDKSATSYYDSDSDEGVRDPRQSQSRAAEVNDGIEVEEETLSAAIRYEVFSKSLFFIYSLVHSFHCSDKIFSGNIKFYFGYFYNLSVM